MNPTITLFINPLTVNNIKLTLLSRALSIEPVFKHIAINQGQQREESFLALNPDGKVPVLQQGDLVLTESNAIMQYLAASQNSFLWPEAVEHQAKVLRVLFGQTNYFTRSVGIIAHRRVVLPFWGAAKREISEQQWQDFHHAMMGLEAILTKSSFVAGDFMSIADISLVAFFIFHQSANMPLAAYPNISRWLMQLSNCTWYQETEQELQQILSN